MVFEVPSIPTNIVLNTIFNNKILGVRPVDNFTPDHFDIDRYDIHYWNIETLIRNTIESVPVGNLFNSQYTRSLLLNLKQELSFMGSLYENIDCKLIIYVPNYKHVRDMFYEPPKANIKTLGKVTQKVMKEQMILNTVKYLNPQFFQELDLNHIFIKTKLPSSNKEVLITTHHPVDLLNYKYIPKLSLMESHTGKLKSYRSFNSKYSPLGKQKYDNLPFLEELLIMIGDRDFIKGEGIVIKRLLMEVSTILKITPFTKKERMLKLFSSESELSKYMKKSDKILK